MKIFSRLRSRHIQSESFRKITTNIFWLALDKLIRFGVGLFVGVWVARYLGPQEYGQWNYAIAFAALFGAFANLGLDAIVIREIVRNTRPTNQLLGTAFYLKLFSGCFAMILATALAVFLKKAGDNTSMLVFLSSLGFLFQSFGVIDFYFQSQITSKFSVYAQNLAFIIVAVAKIVLLCSSGTLIAFAYLGLMEVVLSSCFLVVFYWKNNHSIRSWYFDKETAFDFLKDSWPLILAYFSFVVYSKVDQVLIGELLDSRSVGIYSAAYRIYEIPFQLIGVVAQSVSPLMMRLYIEDSARYLRVYGLLTSIASLCSYLLCIAVFLCSDYVFLHLFGPSYSESSKIFKILTLGQIFMFNAFLRSTHLTIANGQIVLLISTIVAALVNISLNAWLIPQFGIVGAAWTTVFTQLFSLLLLNVLFRKSRELFFIQFRSLFLFPALKYFRK